jgi:hypothetical protein
MLQKKFSHKNGHYTNRPLSIQNLFKMLYNNQVNQQVTDGNN